MAITTKFNSIAQTFCAKIGDPITIVSSIIVAGKVLTKAQVEDYVNRAMEKFFAAKWTEFKGDVEMFVNFFPELVEQVNNLTIVAGLTPVSSYGNIFKLFGCRSGNVYVRIWDVSKYSIVKSNQRIQYIGSSDHPGVILKGTHLEFFGLTASTNLDFEYIQRPVQTDGSAFASSASGEDSPFYAHWTEIIAQLASELYNTDAQNNS